MARDFVGSREVVVSRDLELGASHVTALPGGWSGRTWWSAEEEG